MYALMTYVLDVTDSTASDSTIWSASGTKYSSVISTVHTNLTVAVAEEALSGWGIIAA